MSESNRPHGEEGIYTSSSRGDEPVGLKYRCTMRGTVRHDEWRGVVYAPEEAAWRRWLRRAWATVRKLVR